MDNGVKCRKLRPECGLGTELGARFRLLVEKPLYLFLSFFFFLILGPFFEIEFGVANLP